MGRPPIHDHPMTGAERQRRHYWAKRANPVVPAAAVPVAPLPPDPAAAAAAKLIGHIQTHPREAALWLRGKLGAAAADDLARALRDDVTLRGNWINLAHLRIAPDKVSGWLADKLSPDAPPAAHAALTQAFQALAQVLQTIG